MRTKNYLIPVLFLIFTATNLFTQNQLQRLNGSTVYYDFAKFRNDSNSTYLELYYSISVNALKSDKELDELNVKSDIQISIYSDSGSNKLAEKNIKLKSILIPGESTDNKFITGIKSFILKQGDYIFKILITDGRDTTNNFATDFAVKVLPNENNKITLSSIELCSNIIEGSENKTSYFYKNSYEVFPNASLLFGEGVPSLFYYVELYNLKVSNPEHPLNMLMTVTDAQNKVKIRKQKPVNRSYNSIVEVGVVNINKFSSGTYNIIIGVYDTLSGQGVVSTKKFFVYNTKIKDTTMIKPAEINYLASEFAVMQEDEIDRKFEQAKYLSTNDEIKQWSKLTGLESKREFFFNFWRIRDPDILTTANEKKDDYFNKVQYADAHYSTGKTPGWKSDRGRILLTYGEPSEIERFPNEMDSYPYEIWHYNQLEGGSVFVFGDLTGFSQMTLLHSTYRGELRDDSWFNRIKKSK